MTAIAVFILTGLLPVLIDGNSPYFSELENLKPSQIAALEKFKKAVSPIVPENYMREDIYLVKWLQFNNFNVRRSMDMLTEALRWRKEVKINQWEHPDFFADFEKKGDYPIFTDGFDREGRPIVEGFFGDWNVRAVAVSGKIKHLTHYCLRGIERATRKLREIQANGGNNTQWILLVNMDGFNLINQACPTCNYPQKNFFYQGLPLYLGYVSYAEKIWPNSIYRSILINTPDSFEVILNLIRPIISPQTRAALNVFGVNKNEWKPYLDKLIDPSEISDWYDPKGKEMKIY